MQEINRIQQLLERADALEQTCTETQVKTINKSIGFFGFYVEIDFIEDYLQCNQPFGYQETRNNLQMIARVQKYLFDRKPPHWTAENDATEGFEPFSDAGIRAHFVNGLWAQQRSTFKVIGPDLVGQLRNLFPRW